MSFVNTIPTIFLSLVALVSLTSLASMLFFLSPEISTFFDDVGATPSIIFIITLGSLGLLLISSLLLLLSKNTYPKFFLFLFTISYLPVPVCLLLITLASNDLELDELDIQNLSQSCVELNLTGFICYEGFEERLISDEYYVFYVLIGLILILLPLFLLSACKNEEEEEDYPEVEIERRNQTLSPGLKTISRGFSGISWRGPKVTNKPPPGLGYSDKNLAANVQEREVMGYDTMKRMREVSGNRLANSRNRAEKEAAADENDDDVDLGFTRRNFGARGGGMNYHAFDDDISRRI